MEVAQALSEYNTPNEESANTQDETSRPVAEPTPEPVARPRNIVPPSPERRRSSYERFSVMPPLKEEATPNATPFGTMTRTPDTLSRGATFDKALSSTRQEYSQGAKEVKREKNAVHFGGSS